MTDRALVELGVTVPDSAFARAARELIAAVAPSFLVNHSVRSYAWAVELARHDRVQFDAEILYVAALLHDIGLVPAYDRGGCFEIDGALAAQAFAHEAGQPGHRARSIHDVIAFHMLETLPPDPAPEVVLLWDSTGTDVTGYRFTDVRPAFLPGLLAAYPRLDFKRDFAALFLDQAARKPHCRVSEIVASGKLEAIAAAPFDS
jgi:hypothetical protein